MQALEVPTRPPSPLTCSCRLFTVYPSTKIYFKHLGACPDEVNLLSHGKRMLEAVGVAVQHMDNLRWALSPLADLHAHVLRVDPANFPVRQLRPPGRSCAQPGGGVWCWGFREEVEGADTLSPAPSLLAADPVLPGSAGLPLARRVHGGNASGVG